MAVGSATLCELEPTVSKGQYGVSVRHNPTLHKRLATLANWYDVELQRAFDILVWDRANDLMRQMQKDLAADEDESDDRPHLSFEALVLKLFGITVPPELAPRRGGAAKPSGPKPGATKTTRKR